MSYLARLKRLEADEKLQHTSYSEPTKPTEPPFDGFVGSIPAANENITGVTEADALDWPDSFDTPSLAALLCMEGGANSCASCMHLRKPGGVSRYCSARSDLPPAYGEGHPLRLLPDDDGEGCGQWVGR